MPTAPTRTEVRTYIGTNGTYSDAAIDSAIATETAAQAKSCRIGTADTYPADLWEALLRRVQRLLEMRSKPLGYQDTATEFGVASSRVGPDPEIRRLEGPFRKLIFGSTTTEDEDPGDDDGSVGELEKASLVATGSGTTDGVDTPLTVIVKPDTTLPSWCTLEDDIFTFTEAGIYASSGVAHIIANFPTTIPGDPDGETSLYAEGHLNDQAWIGSDHYVTGAGEADIDLDGNTGFTNPVGQPAGGEIFFIGNGSALEGDGTTPITDGTWEITFYVEITRFIGGATP